MTKWVHRYIEENSRRWEKERLERKEQEEKKLRDWEKKSRFEKIKLLREKLKEKMSGTSGTPPNKDSETPTGTWSRWRSPSTLTQGSGSHCHPPNLDLTDHDPDLANDLEHGPAHGREHLCRQELDEKLLQELFSEDMIPLERPEPDKIGADNHVPALVSHETTVHMFTDPGEKDTGLNDDKPPGSNPDHHPDNSEHPPLGHMEVDSHDPTLYTDLTDPAEHLLRGPNITDPVENTGLYGPDNHVSELQDDRDPDSGPALYHQGTLEHDPAELLVSTHPDHEQTGVEDHVDTGPDNHYSELHVDKDPVLEPALYHLGTLDHERQDDRDPDSGLALDSTHPDHEQTGVEDHVDTGPDNHYSELHVDKDPALEPVLYHLGTLDHVRREVENEKEPVPDLDHDLIYNTDKSEKLPVTRKEKLEVTIQHIGIECTSEKGEYPECSNPTPKPKDTPEKLRGGVQGGRGAYDETLKGSSAPHNEGPLTPNLHTGINDPFTEMMQDMDQYWIKDICDLCALQFCVCALTKLEMKIKILEDAPDTVIEDNPAENEDTGTGWYPLEGDQETENSNFNSNFERFPAPQSPDHQPYTVGGDQDTKGANYHPQHPDYHPGTEGDVQGEGESGIYGGQLDHKHEHVSGHVVAQEPGRTLGHDSGAIRKLPGKTRISDYYDRKTTEQNKTRLDKPYTEDVQETRRLTPETPRSNRTPQGKLTGSRMKKKKEDRKQKTSLINWMRKKPLEQKEEEELDRNIHRDRNPHDRNMNVDRHENFGITLKKVDLPPKVTIPTEGNMTGTRPKRRQSVLEMINCYNNLNSYNTGSSGANQGGQVDARVGGGHDLPSRNHERLRDDGRSKVAAPPLLRCLTGPVATNKSNLISAVDSVLTNEEMRFSNPVTGIVCPQDSVSIVDSPEEIS